MIIIPLKLRMCRIQKNVLRHILFHLCRPLIISVVTRGYLLKKSACPRISRRLNICKYKLKYNKNNFFPHVLLSLMLNFGNILLTYV